MLGAESLAADHEQSAYLESGREPLPLETSIPGVFAIGDARASSTKSDFPSSYGRFITAVRKLG
ncbi:MAG TPA: hypothetical protein VFI43_04205 [Nitrosospira sp.]|nr:hypothetical protein [Nitrosospira sp.]